MRAANPLDVDDTGNPSYENIQNAAALDRAEEHQAGDELQGYQRKDCNVGECREGVVADLLEGLATPESVITHHTFDACPLARRMGQPRTPGCILVASEEPVDAGNEDGDEQEPGQLMKKAH